MKPKTKPYNPSKDPVLANIVRQIVATANPDKIILFGSRAMGTQKKDSDYDVCVLKKKIDDISELEKKIYLNLYGVGAGVDVVLVNSNRFEKLKDKHFLVYSDVEKHGKVVYEKETGKLF